MPGEQVKNSANETVSFSGNPLRGRNVFVSKGCIRCHAAWGVGSKAAPDLARLGMGKSLLQIAGELWNHSPQMAEMTEERGLARPLISSEEMGDFISYLYYINYFNQPGSPNAGRRLFSEKGCAVCHSIDNNGGRAAPPLDDYRRYASAVFVAQAMWNHGPQMSEAMRTNGIKKPYLQDEEAADLLAYIRGQTPGEIPNDKFMLPGSPAKGHRLFAEKGCAVCHTTSGKTKGGAPDLSKTGARKSIIGIAGAMWNHGPEIWAEMRRASISRPTFSGNEMADIVSYLYFLRYADRPGDETTGKRLFTTKSCAQCHAPESLSASAALSSPTNLMAAMWNHAPKMETLARQRGLAWPTFQADEMRDLVEYVRSMAKPPARAKR
jgi:mono/diheme cytochrome c family protein